MSNSTGSRCLNHPDDEAVHRCGSCRKPLCAKCAKIKAEGVFCSDICWTKIKQHQDRQKTLKVKDAKFEEMERERKNKARLFYSIVAIVLIGAGLFIWKYPHSPFAVSILAVFTPILKKIGLLQ